MENDDCMEIIVLDNKNSKMEWTATGNKTNVRFIELNVQNSKVARQLKFDSPRSNVINNENQKIVQFGKLQENRNVFSKLPPGAVLIKHDNKNNSHETEHRQKNSPKEELKINFDNSNNSAAQNEKRVQRNVKNKKIVEVRRNPTRLSKKILDKDFVTSRQKLLPTKRKENFPISEPNKRIKLSNTAYMNTRSVTKKLDTIGSTTQTPSIYDLIEWKAWPVHGMHERPVFHLEHGLGIQYSDKFIKKNNANLDQNTFDESETESEKLHNDEDFQRLKKLICERIESLDLHQTEDTRDNDADIFEKMMHSSLHSVLAFCTQISSQEYQTAIQNKLKLIKAKITTDNQEPSNDNRNERKFENIDNKPTTSVSPGNICKSKNVSNNTYKVLKFIAARMEPAKCLITPRKTVANIPNNSVTNIQNNCSKLQDIIRGSSKNALILLKIQDPPKANSKRIENPCPSTPHNNQFVKSSATNLNWNDSAISNNSTMNITSFYENFIPLEEENYLQQSDQEEKLKSETKNEDQNKINELTQNTNGTLETVAAHEFITNICKGSETQNCDFQTEAANVRNNFDFSDQRKFFYHKPTAFMDERKRHDKPENEEIMEALDLSTVRSKKETAKLGKEIIKSKQDTVKSREEILILKSKESASKKVGELINKEDLQTLMENTIILYCIITGVNQEKVANYIDTLNPTENLEWLKNCN